MAGSKAVPGRSSGMDVVTFGSVFLEIVFGHFDRLPHPGEEIYVDTFAFSCGGGAIGASVAARRAGASAAMASVLGDDLGSRLAQDLALREGVDISLCPRVDGPAAGITVVLNFDDDRAFITHVPPRPADEVLEPETSVEVLRRLRPTWCYLHASPGAADVVRHARQMGIRVALDVSPEAIDRARPEVLEGAQLADAFLPTEHELLLLTGAPDLNEAIAIAAPWCPWLVVKRGPRGAVVVENGGAREVTAGLRDVVVRDRTGAGDAFAGAMIGTVARGGDLLAAVAAGNAAGSAAVARLGSAGDLREPGEVYRL